jgi:hypothetical protein
MGAIILQLWVSPGPEYASGDRHRVTMMDGSGRDTKQLKKGESMHLALRAPVPHVHKVVWVA